MTTLQLNTTRKVQDSQFQAPVPLNTSEPKNLEVFEKSNFSHKKLLYTKVTRTQIVGKVKNRIPTCNKRRKTIEYLEPNISNLNLKSYS